MKRNALIRIILWGCLLAFLLYALFGMLYSMYWNKNRVHVTEATMIPVTVPNANTAYAAEEVNVRSAPSLEAEVVGMLHRGAAVEIQREETIGGHHWAFLSYPITGWVVMEYIANEALPLETSVAYGAPDTGEAVTIADDTVPYTNTAYAADEVNVRSAPSMEAGVVGMLHSGAAVEIQKEEIINGTRWAYLSYPISGWVRMEYIANEALPLETTATAGAPDAGEAVTIAVDAVRDLEIDWVAGNILIQPMDIQQIRIEETEVDSKKDALVWKLKNGQLSIDFCEDDDRFVFQGTELRKDLTIYVPMDWNCASLEMDVASANVEINDLTIGEVEFDGASGKCSFGNCIVDRLDIDTASGDIRYTGTLEILEYDAASANVLAVFENVPSRLAMDTMSGSLDITLPEDAGFTLDMDSMQKNFSSEFQDITVQNDQYLRGDGSCRIRISAMSGDVMLRKAPAA